MLECWSWLYNVKGSHVKTAKDPGKILAGAKNIAFSDICLVAEGFGFRLSHVSGSHHIFTHPQIKELVNLQNVHGQAKTYQIRQFMDLVERHNLNLED